MKITIRKVLNSVLSVLKNHSLFLKNITTNRDKPLQNFPLFLNFRPRKFRSRDLVPSNLVRIHPLSLPMLCPNCNVSRSAIFCYKRNTKFSAQNSRFFSVLESLTGASPTLRDRGEGGSKIKIRGAKLKTSVEFDPNFHCSWIGLRQSFSENLRKKSSSPKSEGFFWPRSQILTFFRPKTATFSTQKNTVGGKK